MNNASLLQNTSQGDRSGRPPKVSIGLPVYNGERYLRQAIESLLQQDFTDFELLISDNASTDRTWEICQEYASRDSRIRLYRHARNVGAISNFEFVFNNTTGEYFLWHAHDDLRSKNTLTECVDFLENHPDYVLCYTTTTVVDNEGKEIFSLFSDFSWDDADRVTRLENCLDSYGQCHAIYGLIRRTALKAVLPIPQTPCAGDTIVVALLCILGKCGEMRSANRGFRQRTFSSIQEAREHYPKALFGPEAKTWFFPLTNAAVIIIRSIWGLDAISLTEKMRLIRVAVRSDMFSGCLRKDLLDILKLIVFRWGGDSLYLKARNLKRWMNKKIAFTQLLVT